ncbi:MAG: type I-C CRISPR-associated protein Cas8c/Csd1 [Anaerolineales bacterium]
MSWIQKLYETYNNCQSMIGAGADDNEVPLLPICHTTQKAQIEIVIGEEGAFRRARVIPKEEARTIIPCTEKSGGRTSGESAHPLCDKLQYVAADYKKYGGNKDSYHDSYLKLLSNWADQEKNKKVQLIYEYVQKGTVIADLIDNNILFTDSNKKLLKQRLGDKDKKDGLDIFDLLPGRVNPKGKIENWQADAFVRWRVEIPNDPQSSVWDDREIIQSWISYYSSTKEAMALCYVTGEDSFSADQHPAKLRNDGDKAKLISSNDNSGFTFRGRFITAAQAASVGFETTQKAHFALRWLISRQGYRKGDLAIVAWATSGATIPKPTDDPLSILGINELPTDAPPTASTAQEVAIKLKYKIAGYGKDIGDTTDIVVMGLDSASPGRLAITYYRELTGSDFLQRINNWHESCSWLHNYGYIEIQDEKSGKTKKKYIPFIGAPSPNDIVEAAYGSHLDDNLRKTTIARILPCIIDGQPIPRDLVESVIRRVSNRVGFKDSRDKKDTYENDWNKALSIACALFKKSKEKEKYDMALDPNRKTRDYLYGRLLALADSLEEWALNKAGENRETNAARLMQRFSERPYSTWRTIELALSPYKARLGGKSKKRQRMIDEVIASFDNNDFINDRRLSGEFLLGYHCQREFLRNTHEEAENADAEISGTISDTNQ